MIKAEKGRPLNLYNPECLGELAGRVAAESGADNVVIIASWKDKGWSSSIGGATPGDLKESLRILEQIIVRMGWETTSSGWPVSPTVVN